LKNIIKNQIWNPLIRHRYSLHSKSLQNTHTKKDEKFESLGLALHNYRIQNTRGDVTNLKFSQKKSILKLKQELMPFFADIKIPTKIKNEYTIRKTNNSTELSNKQRNQ
jgi:hypothetical protein